MKMGDVIAARIIIRGPVISYFCAAAKTFSTSSYDSHFITPKPLINLKSAPSTLLGSSKAMVSSQLSAVLYWCRDIISRKNPDVVRSVNSVVHTIGRREDDVRIIFGKRSVVRAGLISSQDTIA